MKLAILSESSADDAAIKILIDAIIGEETELVSPHPRYDFKTRGWPQALQLLKPFFSYWYYETEAEAVVIIVDSDDSPIHQPEHKEVDGMNEKCRHCLLQKKIEEIHSQITLPDGREEMKIAIGISTPAIEAWFCCLDDSHVTEATWSRRNIEKVKYDRKSLKKTVYGSERASRKMIEDGSMNAVQKIIKELEEVEKRFPQGFGSLVKDIRNW